MFFIKVFVITLISVYSGASSLHPQTKSNHATYSQSFVREDVPLSYKYSATHHYTTKRPEDTQKRHEGVLERQEDFPKRHEVSYEDNSGIKFNHSPFKQLSNKTIQFAPLPPNPREYTYPPAPAWHTSIDSSPATKYENYELTENSAESVLNLEPKRIPTNVKNISPSTYRPHMNHDIKMFHSHHSHLRPNYYRSLNKQPMAITGATPKYEMDNNLLHLGIFHQLQQQLDEQPMYITTTSTENPKHSHVLNLGVRILPKQAIPLITMPHESIRNTPFQPIPRIAYQNKFNVAPEKPIRSSVQTRYNYVHFSKPNMQEALRIQTRKPNIQ